MASTFAAAAACSSDAAALPLKKYDVFISFRGEDTRVSFTSHLNDALTRHGIKTYIDNMIEKGDEVWPSLVEAIRDSSVFLVIFSKNYASSTWCLNELKEIMECAKKGDGAVIPVFLRIDPSRVRKQVGSYKAAFTKHEQDPKHRKMMQKWKDALSDAANVSGFHSRKYRTECDMIDDIIQSILRKLSYKHSIELRGLFIPDINYRLIESSLRIEAREVRIIGLWGMGGIGKTTIAEAIFQDACSQYEGSCFLADVREQSKKNGVNYIWSTLLCRLLGKDFQIDTPNLIPRDVMNRLRRMKVFIVLDDVHSLEIIENLIGVGRDWLGARSRVIVTTRDKHVLISSGVDEIHEVKEMNSQNSRQLFNLHAFHKTDPDKGYEELSVRAIAYAKGMPLALKVLGSFLYYKGENEWDSALRKLEESPNAEIQKVLKISYEELDDKEKNIFLDIASVFKGWHQAQVLELLNACGFFADIGIRNLLGKALISIDDHGHIRMHDLIQEMGREIIHCESINPGQRSRLWDFEEVCNVLENNTGTAAIQIICFDLGQATHHLHLSSHAFTNMRNLRVLIVNNKYGEMEYLHGPRDMNYVHVPRDLKLPNNLIYIRWDGFPLKYLPSNCWEMLADLSMKNSNVRKLWDGVTNLPNLKRIDLEGSNLEECSNLSGARNLESLRLSFCRSLRHVHPSVFSLPKLKKVYVAFCVALKSLCSNNYSPSLRELVAYGCTNLRKFSVTMPDDIYRLDLLGTCLNKPPSSILHLRNVSLFCFPICESLIDLPETFTAGEIFLRGSNKNDFDACIALHTAFSGPGFQKVKELFVDFSETVFELPDSICLLSSLERLSLHLTSVISLPESIKDLPCLKSLYVYSCRYLQSVPALPQSIRDFDASECCSLNKVLSVLSEPSGSEIGWCEFTLTDCIKLDLDSFHSILKHAISSIGLGVLEDEVECNRIRYFLPNIAGKARDWFHLYSTQALISVELPPDFKFLGFFIFLVLPQVLLDGFTEFSLGRERCYLEFSCECLVEKSSGESVDVQSFSYGSSSVKPLRADHVLLWYDARFCKAIIEATKERKASNVGTTSNNPKLIFKFFASSAFWGNKVMKECGIRWIYPFEDQVVVDGMCEFKSNIENHEMEACPIRNGAERFESHEGELVPPTHNINQHAIETCSNLDEEVEKFRPSLEELLHIGFGRGFM